MANFQARNISDELQTVIETAKKKHGMTNDGIFNTLASLIPLYEVIQNKGMTLEHAIERITADNVITEIKIIKKGINESEFAIWKERLFNHNANCEQDYKVFISQNLFLELIGGNIQSISKQFQMFKAEIDAHNAENNLSQGDNRKLSNRLRESKQADSLIDWLKVKLR